MEKAQLDRKSFVTVRASHPMGVSEAMGKRAHFWLLHKISGGFTPGLYGAQGVPSSNLGAPTNSHRVAGHDRAPSGSIPTAKGEACADRWQSGGDRGG